MFRCDSRTNDASGRRREGRRKGVELLNDLHRALKNHPLLKKPTPPHEEATYLLFPLLNKRLKNPPPLLKNPPSLLQNPPSLPLSIDSPS